MSDPIRIEPDYIGWAAYYDPEGPVGRGSSKEIALGDLIDQCDDDHCGPLLLGAIVAALAKIPRGASPAAEERGNSSGGAAKPSSTSMDSDNAAPTILNPPMFGDVERLLRRRHNLMFPACSGLYLAAADAIRDLRAALASQIEITNTERERNVHSQFHVCPKCHERYELHADGLGWTSHGNERTEDVAVNHGHEICPSPRACEHLGCQGKCKSHAINLD